MRSLDLVEVNMANQIEKHVFTDPDGNEIFVALLDNGAIRIRFKGDRKTAVTWHATGNGRNSVTIVTPQTG